MQGRRLRLLGRVVACVVALMLLAAPSEAVPLAPGTVAAVDAGLAPGGGDVLLAFTEGSDSSASGALEVTIRAAVYRNTAGFLDFYFQVVNNSAAEASHRFTNFDFSGFDTDVSQVADAGIAGFSVGTQAVVNADRNGTGSAVGFNFGPGAFACGISPSGDCLDPGETSYVVIIRTNAEDYRAGFTQAIDGGVAEVQTFGPNPIPEPGSMMLLGSGLFGLAATLRRRLRK